MAGTILISHGKDSSRGSGLPLNGWAFRHFIEAIREQLKQSPGQQYIPEIYFGNDEAFSGFISVCELESEPFNLFYDATLAASIADSEADSSGREVWNALLKLLRDDPRWDQNFRR